ncbi:MAG: beta-hydroxyacyl-ACP dehydratase [Eubacteriaceae bacterium]|nr:beta-hydroxyacyl-ACP dehydratase [Eubacteriaceae bacterium]
MNREEIMAIIPHRDDMLLIDEAQVKDGKAYGKYTFKGTEWFFNGHFPKNPVVPGVILCEIIAQTASVLMAGSTEQAAMTPYFTGLDNVRFRKKVLPGDVFETECVIVKSKGPFYFASGKGYTNHELCVSADFSFALQK